MQKKGVQGRKKICDIRENIPYIVKKQPIPDIPVYVVQEENSNRKPRLLHRNMLLPFNGLPRPEDEEIDHKRSQQEQIPTPEMIEPSYSDSSSDSSSEVDYVSNRRSTPRKDIPTRRGRPLSSTTITDQRPLRRGQRWMQQDDWEFNNPPRVINVNAKELVYI